MKLIKILGEIELSKRECEEWKDIFKTYDVADLEYALCRAQRQRQNDEDSTYSLHDTH